MLIDNNHHREIRNHHLFQSIPEQIFNNILMHCGLMSFKCHELIFAKDDEAEFFYLIRSGQVVTFDESSVGKEKIINIFEPGNIFSENILFNKEQRYEYSARTMIETELYYFDALSFKSLLLKSNDIKLCINLLSEFSRQISSQTQEIVQLSINSAQYRLISYLLKKCCGEGSQCCRGVVNLTTTKTILASRLSITSETLSRVLGSLKKQGLIAINNETITILQPDTLRQLIE